MRIAILLLPEALNSTITGPADVLLTASLVSNLSWKIETVAESSEAIVCFNGISISPAQSIFSNHKYDLVIIPSIIVNHDGLIEPHLPLIEWLKKQANNGAQLASICTGAFLLAETGLLNGKSATTHWEFCDAFRKKYPRIELKEKLTFIDNGSTMCCSAGSAWQDLILYILQQHMDNSVVLNISETYQLQRHNSGQQAFCGLPSGMLSDRAIEKALKVLKEKLSDAQAFEYALAASKLTPRTFQRRFKAFSGTSPAHFLQLLRVERAKEILTFENKPIDLVCFDVGYEDASYLRRLFKKETGMSMREYRLRFSVGATDENNV